MTPSQRIQQLLVLQQHYASFEDFAEEGMEFLGFRLTPVQRSIARFMEYGPDNSMVQAQRSQAKTTVAALYAVWSIIHNPRIRILVVSAGGRLASDISRLIVRIVMHFPGLECLHPDRQAGDLTSSEAFDIHYALRDRPDKSPTVKCLGITANLQGNRADLLLADDVESTKNAATAGNRAKLLEGTREFVSIVQSGRILWLGTPQTNTSIYNTLPSRGVTVRIWPGRYPTPQQREAYGNKLAPDIAKALMVNPSLGTGGGVLGDQGKPTDPTLLGEEALQKKELNQTTPYFQLQHMLNTALTDAMRYPLKPEQLVVMRLPAGRAPSTVVRGMLDTHLREFSNGEFSFRVSTPHEVSSETLPLQSVTMYIDPAPGGANADETGYAIGGMLNGNVFVLAAGGIPGGYDKEKMTLLAELAQKYEISAMVIEKNMGYGAFREILLPILREHWACKVEDDYVTGQKERRIINTIAPIMGRGSLILDESVVEQDRAMCARYSAQHRNSYSLFFQLAHISQDKGALGHDDRLDALEGLCRSFQRALSLDQERITAAARERELARLRADPLGLRRFSAAPGTAPYSGTAAGNYASLRTHNRRGFFG